MQNPPVQWPPRSPHEALLSSPSGRRKLREQGPPTSPTPSPSRRADAMSSLRSRPIPMPQLESMVGGDDDDDEETLQLQLQAIEARLKLKRLRQAKMAREAAMPGVEMDGSQRTTAAYSNRPTSTSSGRARGGEFQGAERRLPRSKSQPTIHVPLSPPPKKAPAIDPISPGRVRLGIDKGWTGAEVSLRRPPSSRTSARTPHAGPMPGPLSSTYDSIRSSNPLAGSSSVPRKSFSERMAESRTADKVRKEQEERIKKARSRGFGIDEKEIEVHKASAAADEDPFIAEALSSAPREFTRDEVLQSFHKPSHTGVLRRSKIPSRDPGSTRPFTASTTATVARTHVAHTQSSSASLAVLVPLPSSEPTSPTSLTPSATRPTNDLFEPFSSIHLSRRTLPHTLLTRTFTNKRTLTLPPLLRDTKSPDFIPPEGLTPDNPDVIVLAIVASRSSPLTHAPGSNHSPASDKYLALTLTDLRWSLTLYLFSTAFQRYYKLTPGTVIAILNPSILPPPATQKDTGRFSLALNSSDDTILEIGTARDLGFCAAIRRDGKACGEWVDRRHTDYCMFHVDAQVSKTKAGRMEVNSMSAPFAPGGRSSRGRPGGVFRNAAGTRHHSSNKAGPAFGQRRDPTTRSEIFITPGATTPAQRLDSDDLNPDAFHHGTSKSDRLQRRMAERERERDIARRLGESGNGAGSIYLRQGVGRRPTGSSTPNHHDNNNDATPSSAGTDRRDARSLGLHGEATVAENVRLSPVKHRVGVLSSSITVREGVGWAKASQVGGLGLPPGKTITLLPPAAHLSLPAPFSSSSSSSSSATMLSSAKESDNGMRGNERERGESPARKKTRFITSKGIREAGRDSLGVGEDAGGESDDLEIV